MRPRDMAFLRSLGACDEGLSWAATQTSLRALWRKCERPDWLLWLAGRLDVDRRLIVRAAIACARPALVHVPEDRPEPAVTLDVLDLWTQGEATIEEVHEAREHAWEARQTLWADAYAAAAAAYAATYAAYAATDAAGYAAYAATDAADSAGYAARHASLDRSCHLIRDEIPWCVIDAAIERRR